ncbi:hypothetical protein PoB_004828800 [Plakobranchus ocellatus]|uniref:Uncharacterized protein n=1 Tax=Plakobranchus ocellatus TaxID=259542 RepID=A0AAV4BRM2_9GAST|nr:hypothetical protein PoB_004828800 [Plakobranchus ocellatus]
MLSGPFFSDLDVRDLIDNDPDSKEDDFDSGESDVDENHGHTLNHLMRESIEEPIENLVLDLEASPSSSDGPNDHVYEGQNNVYRSRARSSSIPRNDQAEVVDRRIVRGWVRGRSRGGGPRSRGGTGYNQHSACHHASGIITPNLFIGCNQPMSWVVYLLL